MEIILSFHPATANVSPAPIMIGENACKQKMNQQKEIGCPLKLLFLTHVLLNSTLMSTKSNQI